MQKSPAPVEKSASLGADQAARFWKRPQRGRFPKDGRNGDEQAAVAAWFQWADQTGSLGSFLSPPLTPEERDVAAVEEWILVAV